MREKCARCIGTHPYKNQAHAARRIVRVSQESERFQGCFDSFSFICEWEAVFVALEDLQMLLFAVLLAFQDEDDQESMKIVKKSGNKDMMSNDAQWQAWVAFKNSGGVGGGAAPPICKQNKIIEHDQRC